MRNLLCYDNKRFSKVTRYIDRYIEHGTLRQAAGMPVKMKHDDKGWEQDSGFQNLTGSWRHRLRAPDREENQGNTWEPTG